VGTGPCVNGGGSAVSLSGTIDFERLPLSVLDGLGGSLVTRPVRYADVRLRAAGCGTCYGEASTDGSGAYTISANPPDGASLELVVLARNDLDPLRQVTVHDALPPSSNSHGASNVFAYASAPFTASGFVVLDLTVPYNAGSSVRPSIGFAVYDTIITCVEAIRTGTGQVPPLCHAYTRLGNNGATGTSFYDPGAQALTLLAGASGSLDSSDTDYFDDGVVAHEYGHFLESVMAATANRGGPHGGEDLEPPFAWSEGAATGWGCLLRKDARYIDTVTTGSWSPQINGNAENWTPQLVRGIGGEETVTEVVWDLGDGVGGIADSDGDGVAISLGSLYGRFLAFDPATTAPYLGTLLDSVVGASLVSSGAVSSLLASPENQQVAYPLAGNDIWPVPLPLPGTVTGSVDSLAGSNKNQCRGRSSSTWYGFTLTSSRTLTFSLTITPTSGNGDNLDLFLESPSGGVYAQSTNTGASAELIGPVTLGAGTYILRVEADCAGAGNQAGYSLQVTG
ncbi:MAG: PPC domain-containing protein, partial [Planctomycetia bacterium]